MWNWWNSLFQVFGSAFSVLRLPLRWKVNSYWKWIIYVRWDSISLVNYQNCFSLKAWFFFIVILSHLTLLILLTDKRRNSGQQQQKMLMVCQCDGEDHHFSVILCTWWASKKFFAMVFLLTFYLYPLQLYRSEFLETLNLHWDFLLSSPGLPNWCRLKWVPGNVSEK